MLDVCIKNNDLVLKDYIFKAIKRNEFVPKTLIQLKDDLNMSVIPKRIEAFDNSNIQGEYSVAGMVCFIDGKPSKKEYRHFNIKSVQGIDDRGVNAMSISEITGIPRPTVVRKLQYLILSSSFFILLHLKILDSILWLSSNNFLNFHQVKLFLLAKYNNIFFCLLIK